MLGLDADIVRVEPWPPPVYKPPPSRGNIESVRGKGLTYVTPLLLVGGKQLRCVMDGVSARAVGVDTDMHRPQKKQGRRI
eukprot:4197512-Pyramimonas_sp.AAC.2